MGKTAAVFASGRGNTEVAAILEQAASKPPIVPKVSLLVTADYDCTWKLDGESQGHLASGDSVKVQVELGKHLIEAVTTDGADRYRRVVALTKMQQELVTINLKPIHDGRLREEAWRIEEARKAREAALPTWTDPATGLMWAKKDNGAAINQKGALNYCRLLSLAGFKDWRLPEIDELAAIYDPSANAEDGYWPYVKGGILRTECCSWSATRGNKSGRALILDFRDGSRDSYDVGDVSGRMNYAGRALCVRRAGE
jgi:hypothetical protein